MSKLDVDFEHTQFLALEHLALYTSVVQNFDRSSQLISLELYSFDEQMGKNESWYIRHMPLLASVVFDGRNFFL